MDRLVISGRIIYAIGLLGLGVLCILSKDFIIGRPPSWPETFSAAPVIGYASAALIFLFGISIITNKQAERSLYAIALMIFCLSFTRQLAQFGNNWLGGLKTLALLGGALIIASTVIRHRDRTGKILLHVGILLIALFFIAGGYAHFEYATFVENFIPAYIPFRAFWAYFCGVCLIAGALGMLIPSTRKWAALLSGIMLMGWFFMLHIPRFLANMDDPGDRLGLFESFAISGICFVVAGISFMNKNYRSPAI
jgi:uncharacterized membrane protein